MAQAWSKQNTSKELSIRPWSSRLVFSPHNKNLRVICESSPDETNGRALVTTPVHWLAYIYIYIYIPIRWHAWIHTFDHVWRLQPPWVLYKTQFSLLDSTCLMSTSTSLINKNVKAYRTTAFFLPKHGKTIRFFSFLHVFFFIPNPQASSLAEGHTPHVEQGPADGEQRQSQDLATGNHQWRDRDMAMALWIFRLVH